MATYGIKRKHVAWVAFSAASLAACSEPGGGSLFGNAGSGGGGGEGGGETTRSSTGSGKTSGQASTGQGAGSGTSSTTTAQGPVTSTTVTTSSGGCLGDEYACFSGGCIPGFWACDSVPDCPDGSDEAPINLNCGGVVSSVATGGCDFACTGGGCTSSAQVCNGVPDCFDSSDETFCGPTGWTCQTSFYGSADGCDCGCGIKDPDCTSNNVSACDYCADPGSCAIDCTYVRENQNWMCVGDD